MPNAKLISVRDFSKGLNDLVPPDQLESSEAVELINLVPGDEGRPLAVRPGYARLDEVQLADFPITGLTRFRTASGAKHWVASCNDGIYTTARSAATSDIRPNSGDITYSNTPVTKGFEGDDWLADMTVLPGGNTSKYGDAASPQGYNSDSCLKISAVHRALNVPDAVYAIKDQYGIHELRWKLTGTAATPARIKVGRRTYGYDVRESGEFVFEIRTSAGQTQVRVVWMQMYTKRYTEWSTVTSDVWHRLKWRFADTVLEVWGDNETPLMFSVVNTIKHDSVQFSAESNGATGSFFLLIDDITDFVPHWSVPDHRETATSTPGATVSYSRTPEVLGERLQIRASVAEGDVAVTVDGVAHGTFTRPAPSVGQGLEPTVVYEITFADLLEHDVVVTTAGVLGFFGFTVASPDTSMVKIATLTGAGEDVDFAVFMDKLFSANVTDGLMMWDGVGAAASSVTGAPAISKLITFRSRLWGTGNPANPSAVYFSAPSDYTGWTGDADDDGGEMLIEPDNGEIVVGLGRLFNGVVVFKERSIWLWTYGDADRPDLHGRIEQLVPGVGLVSHESIAYYNGALIFMGQNAEGDFGIYRLTGSGVDEYSVKIPKSLRRILPTSTKVPKGIAHNHYYYLAVDDAQSGAHERTLVYAFDLRRQCWTIFTQMSVGAWAVDRDRGYLYFGSGVTGLIYQYGIEGGDDGLPIPFRYVSRPFNGGNSFAGHRWRNMWIDVLGSAEGQLRFGYQLDGQEPVWTTHSLTVPGTHFWDEDGLYWDQEDLVYSDLETEQRISVPLPSNRSGHIVVLVEGESGSGIAYARYGIAYRDRKVSYN